MSIKVVPGEHSQCNLAEARRLMREALDLLDALDAPLDASAHLDLAIHRVENYLGLDAPGEGGANALRNALERELTSSRAETPDDCPWEIHPF